MAEVRRNKKVNGDVIQGSEVDQPWKIKCRCNLEEGDHFGYTNVVDAVVGLEMQQW